MERKSIADINQYSGSSINPSDTPDTIYELYSVPSYENQAPEIIKGKEIGSSKITVEDGDVLICKINPRINRVWVVKRHTPYQLLASSEWIVIRNHELNSDYLKWYFSSPFFRELMTSQVAGIGGSLTRAQPKQVAKYPVPIVKVGEQRKIAAVLDKVSDLIAKRRQQLDKLDELIKARFVEMFGDMVLNTKGWSTQPLEEIADIVSGITKGRKVKEQELIEVPYMAVSNVKDGYIDWTTVKTISATHSEIEQYRLLPDDILMTEGGDPDKLGRGAIIQNPPENCIHQNHIFRVRLDETLLLPCYFAEFLKHQKAKQYFLRCAKQTTGIASINMRQLKGLPTLVPPLELQNQFAAFVEQTEKTKITISKSLEKLEILKKALMQKYFGGGKL